MRLPRGSASTLLSLIAGLAAAVAVATTWLPVIRYAEMHEADILSRQLSQIARLTAEQVSMEDSASLQAAIDQIPTIAAIDLAAVLPVDGEPHIAGSGLSAAQLAAVCPADAFSNMPLLQVPPMAFGDQRLTGACAPIWNASGEVVGVTAAFSGLYYEQRLAEQKRRARSLLLLLGSLSGLIVMSFIRLLLSPIQTISRAAAQIANGAHDLRVQIRGPEELAELARAVNALASHLERQEDEISSRMAVVKHLASMVAHEVRNPLQSLSLLCTLARTEENPEKRDTLLASIHEEINVLEGVVQRFLRSSGPLRIRRSQGDLVELLEQVASVSRPRANKAMVSMLIQAPGNCPISMDGSLVRRAMENLILNAIEFAGQKPPGQVTVSLLPRRDQVLFIVEDDGPGVPVHERERVFEQYYSSKPGGTGLGLTLVRRVFETHGGTIRCEGSALGGARFVATIPVSPEG